MMSDELLNDVDENLSESIQKNAKEDYNYDDGNYESLNDLANEPIIDAKNMDFLRSDSTSNNAADGKQDEHDYVSGDEEDENDARNVITSNNNNPNNNEEYDDDEEDDDDDDDDNIKIVIESKPFQAAAVAQVNRTLSKPNQAGGTSTTIATTMPTKPTNLSTAKKVDVDGVPEHLVDLSSLADEKKLWLKPGADITDYFNYGFTEETWNAYDNKQKRLRAENSSLKMNGCDSNASFGSTQSMNHSINGDMTASTTSVPFQVNYGHNSHNNGYQSNRSYQPRLNHSQHHPQQQQQSHHHMRSQHQYSSQYVSTAPNGSSMPDLTAPPPNWSLPPPSGIMLGQTSQSNTQIIGRQQQQPNSRILSQSNLNLGTNNQFNYSAPLFVNNNNSNNNNSNGNQQLNNYSYHSNISYRPSPSNNQIPMISHHMSQTTHLQHQHQQQQQWEKPIDGTIKQRESSMSPQPIQSSSSMSSRAFNLEKSKDSRSPTPSPLGTARFSKSPTVVDSSASTGRYQSKESENKPYRHRDYRDRDYDREYHSRRSSSRSRRHHHRSYHDRRDKSRSRSRSRSRDRSRDKDRSRSRDRSRDKNRSRSREYNQQRRGK